MFLIGKDSKVQCLKSVRNQRKPCGKNKKKCENDVFSCKENQKIEKNRIKYNFQN